MRTGDHHPPMAKEHALPDGAYELLSVWQSDEGLTVAIAEVGEGMPRTEPIDWDYLMQGIANSISLTSSPTEARQALLAGLKYLDEVSPAAGG